MKLLNVIFLIVLAGLVGAGSCTDTPTPVPPHVQTPLLQLKANCAEYTVAECNAGAMTLDGKKCAVGSSGLCEDAPKPNACKDFSLADCGGAIAANGKQCAVGPNGDCVEASPVSCFEYPAVEADCQGQFNRAGKRCDIYFDVAGPICSEQRRRNCYGYSPADCVNAKNEAGYDCALDAAGQCGNAPRDTCVDFPNDQCDQFARLKNGNGCKLDAGKCKEIPLAAPILQPNCGDYKNAIHCAQKTSANKDCTWDIGAGVCKDKAIGLANCSDYTPVNCLAATPVSLKKCKIGSKSGTCVDEAVLLDPYYRKKDGQPLRRNPKYTQPAKGTYTHVHCLGRGSNYFTSDDEVNQFAADLAYMADEPFYLYRWGDKQYEIQRVKDDRKCKVPYAGVAAPIMQILKPFSSSESYDVKNRNLGDPCAANGSGAAVYGLGLYSAKTPFSSIGYASAEPQTFALDIRVEPGTLLLDPNRALPDGSTVRQEMTRAGISDNDIFNCNPPVIFEIGLGGWVVIKDPIGMSDTIEFNAREFKANKTIQQFRNSIDSSGGSEDAKKYLKKRAQ